MTASRMTNKEINKAFDNLMLKYQLFRRDVLKFQKEIESKISGSISNFNSEKALIDEFKTNNESEISSFKEEQESKLSEIISSINSEKEKLDSYYAELFENEESIASTIEVLKNEIQEYHAKLLTGNGDSKAISEKINSAYRQILDYKNELFGYKEKDENDNLIEHPGVKDEIEDLIKQYENQLELFSSKTKQLIDKKTKEMDELLSKMNLNYNAVEQEALSKKFFTLSKHKENSIKWSTILLTVYSIALTGALMYLFTCASLTSLFGNNLIAGSIIRIAITVPIMYLIVSTAGRIRREITIRDQYNFKGSIMSTYRNISTHIKNEDVYISEEKQTELLEKVFNLILENESDKIEANSSSGLKNITKTVENLAKELGTDKSTLIAIIPDVLEKVSEMRKKTYKEKLESTKDIEESDDES
ncbi:MAG: hypothetical protein JEY96_19650 [Bacteroidales bacterium]|nr:hypothetical protein [Bacteroidales bacterium]